MPLDNNSEVTAITYPEAGKQRIYAFVNGTDHLYVNYWDGTHWHWADQGGVPGGFQGSLKHLNIPSAITYQEAGKQRIYAFLVGDDGVGGQRALHVNYWDGNGWRWADQGAPPNTMLKQIPSAITYSEDGKERIYVFVGGSDHDLYVNYWDGAHWQWADQGHPPVINPSMDIGGKGTISYAGAGKQHIYAFAAIGKHLYVDYWDGSGWHWSDQGTPFATINNSSLTTLDAAITFVEGGIQHIEEFIIGTDQVLHRNHWDGSNWVWSYPGTPPNVNIDRMVGGLSYLPIRLEQVWLPRREGRRRVGGR